MLDGAKHYERNRDVELRLRSGVIIVNSPLVHLGGLFRILQCVNDGRSFCLLERFRVDEWADAVRRHRPRTVSLVPAALRMVLEADLDPADLASVRSVISGTAPLDPDDADAFRERYGVPVLISYAATEFGGGVAGWNLADHEQFWAAKRGSVGRAHPGCELRVVDPETGDAARPGRGGPARGEGPPDGRRRRLDPHHRPGPHRRRRLRVDPRPGRPGDHPRRVQDPARRRAGRARARPAGARRGRREPGRRPPRRRARWPPSSCGPARRSRRPTTCSAEAAKVLARYELPDELRVVDALPRTPGRQGRPRRRARAVRRGALMDLTYSDEDEAFRAELRAWLEVEVPGPRPAAPARRLAGPPRLRHRVAAQAPRRRATPASHWPKEFGGRGLPVTQQLVYLEEYARADAPYISVNFVGMMHAGPTLIAEGTDEQRAFHLPRILRGETRLVPGLLRAAGRAPTWRRCAPARCARATSTS